MSFKTRSPVGRQNAIKVIGNSDGFESVEEAAAKLVDDPRFGLVQTGRSAWRNALPFQYQRYCEE